jgi:hypothetical protein
MKKVQTEMATGKILAYDTTIVTPEKSSTLLARGHKITRKDVERLKDSGVYSVWVDDGDEHLIHEWDISSKIAKKAADPGSVEVVDGKHGIAYLFSRNPGILTVNSEMMLKFNLNGKVLLITRMEGTAVGKGEIVGAVDVIPLSLRRREMKSISSIIRGRMVSVKPFKYSSVGLVITGSEIYDGRKKDQYYPVIRKKCEKYGWKIVYRKIVPDDEDMTAEAIREARRTGAEAVIVTGGMSVDATDRTPASIRKIGADIIAYGIPMKPTTMSLVAIWNGIPVFGISAGGIHYADFNSIDVVFTRMMAGYIPTAEDIARMGSGGMFGSYSISINALKK